MSLGIPAISIKPTIGIGDAVQFTSLPENYYLHTGKVLAEGKAVGSKDFHWVLDYNPFVQRNLDVVFGAKLNVTELWNTEPTFKPRPVVYLSNAEHHASLFQVPVVRSRPRLYRFEDYPIQKRHTILFQTHGVSHGAMPDHVIDHVLKKYAGMDLYHIGLPSDPDIGIPKIETPTIWELVELISECRMFIGMDSGPSWIAACYPDVIIKKLRTKPAPEQFKQWVPLEISNIHAHWDDRMFQIFNPSEDDLGFTWSYKRI